MEYYVYARVKFPVTDTHVYLSPVLSLFLRETGIYHLWLSNLTTALSSVEKTTHTLAVLTGSDHGWRFLMPVITAREYVCTHNKFKDSGSLYVRITILPISANTVNTFSVSYWDVGVVYFKGLKQQCTVSAGYK